MIGCSLCKPRGQMLSYEESTAFECVIRDEAVLRKAAKNNSLDDRLRVVSLKSIAKLVDAHRASVRRWLNGEGARLRCRERATARSDIGGAVGIERWLKEREEVD